MTQNSKQPSLTEEVDSKLSQVTVEEVEKWITDDLGRSRSFLQAIHDDKNILHLVAIHMHGKLQNFKNGKDSLKKASEETE